MNLELLLSRESLLVVSLIVLNIILILLFHDQELVCVLLGILSVMAYFVMSQQPRQNKINKAIVLLNVVFWGMLIESFGGDSWLPKEVESNIKSQLNAYGLD